MYNVDDVQCWWCPLCRILIVLAHWNNNLRVDTLLHWFDILSWFRDIQSLLLFLIVVYFTEKQRMPILLSLVLPEWGSNTRSTTLEESTLYPLSQWCGFRSGLTNEYTWYVWYSGTSIIRHMSFSTHEFSDTWVFRHHLIKMWLILAVV
jgi:hypothetical protein